MLAVASKLSVAGSSPSRHPETEALTNATVILDPGEHCAARRPLAPPARTRRTHPRERRRLPCRPARIDCGSGASSDSIDLRDKRRAYCRNGVREYLVWLVAEARLEWFCLEDDDYRPQLPDAQGELHSRVFPGLRLPVAPLLTGDTAKVLARLTEDEPLNRRPPKTSVYSVG